MAFRTAKVLIVLSTACLLSAAGPPARSDAAGPWRGQVVDAESGQPLEGVVVLAVWERRSPGLIHPQTDFHDADEVVTDAQGRFVLPARSLKTLNPFVSIRGPRLLMFKAGYGERRFRGEREWRKLDLSEQIKRYEEAEKRFEGDGVVFELTRLRTREERREFLSHASPPGEVPAERMSRYMDVIDQERVWLGFQPLKEDRLKREKKSKEAQQ